jgi:acetate kinase
MSLVVLNAGSSSLKFSLFEHNTLAEIASGVVDWKSGGERATLTVKTDAGTSEKSAAASDYATAVGLALESIAPRGGIRAVGHRVVHGGTRFRESVLIDTRVKEEIDRLSELAPLHNPPAVQVIEAAQRAVADVPQVAVFDTAFFANLPPRGHVYPLPYSWYTDWGVRRFGFHGISHAYCAARAAELLQSPDLRLMICHLGNGCSATAVRGREPVATTMGFTPLEGLMMGTRGGSVDPGILLHLLRRGRMSAEELDSSLNHAAGLKGVSGISGDFREVEKAAAQGNARARLAITLYADRVRSAIGALAVTLGGIDALVFTAGVGENALALRAEVCQGLQCLGLQLDMERNRSCGADADVAHEKSPARILIVHTREEFSIAQEAKRLIGLSRQTEGVKHG